MSGDRKQNLQDTFLNSVLLRRDGQIQLVYKHAISTIMPAGNVSLFEQEQDDD